MYTAGRKQHSGTLYSLASWTSESGTRTPDPTPNYVSGVFRANEIALVAYKTDLKSLTYVDIGRQERRDDVMQSRQI